MGGFALTGTEGAGARRTRNPAAAVSGSGRNGLERHAMRAETEETQQEPGELAGGAGREELQFVAGPDLQLNLPAVPGVSHAQGVRARNNFEGHGVSEHQFAFILAV